MLDGSTSAYDACSDATGATGYRSRSSAAESTGTTAPASWTARVSPTPTFVFDAGSTYTGETQSIGSAAAGSARTESTETARFGSAPAFAFTVISFVGFAPACSDASSYPVTFADARSDAQ